MHVLSSELVMYDKVNVQPTRPRSSRDPVHKAIWSRIESPKIGVYIVRVDHVLMSVGLKLDCSLHCKKKVGDFPVPSRDVPPNSPWRWNNLKFFPATEGLVSDIPR